MRTSDFRIALDVHRTQSQCVLHVKRGDTARRILASLTEGGKPYRIEGADRAVFTAKKPDGTCLFNDCEIAGDTLVYCFTGQTSNVAGRLDCELRLYDAAQELLVSPRFCIFVDDTVYHDGDLLDSSTEATALTKLLRDASEVKALLDERWETGAINGMRDMTEKYAAWRLTAPPGENSERHFLKTLPDGDYRMTNPDGCAWHMRRVTTKNGNVLQHLSGTDGEFLYADIYVDDRHIWQQSSEEGFFAMNGKQYALTEYVDERFQKAQAERDVTKEYAAWRAAAPSDASSVRHFLKTLSDGTYRLTTPEGEAWRMSRVTTKSGNVLQQLSGTDGDFFYADVYVDDTHIWAQSSEEGAFAMNGKQYALTEYVDERFQKAQAERDVTEEYAEWRTTAPPGENAVRHFLKTLPDGTYRLSTPEGEAWRMSRVTTQYGSVLQQLSGTDGCFFYTDVYVDDQHIWEQSSEEGTFAMDGRQYALTEYVDERFQSAHMERDVTNEYEAWLAGHPRGTVQEFLWTLPDGAYRLDSSGGSTYLQRISTADETFRWIAAYSDVCEVSLYQGSACLLSYSGGSTMEFREKPLATEEFVKKQIATLEARIEALEGGRS